MRVLLCIYPFVCSRYKDADDAQKLYLPPAYEVFLERVAFASHNIQHFYEECNFDFELFNKKMRASLYKTKRNRDKVAARTSLNHTEDRDD